MNGTDTRKTAMKSSHGEIRERLVAVIGGPLEVKHAREMGRYERAAWKARRRYGSVWTRI